jgi:hypothetical protein
MLIHLYAVHAWGLNTKDDAEAPRMNGIANGHARADRRIQDAEEFELEGLVSDDDDAGSPIASKEGRPLLNSQH